MPNPTPASAALSPEIRDATAPIIERAAEAIYDAMRENDPAGSRHPWVERGNSLKQDEARRRARSALEALLGEYVARLAEAEEYIAALRGPLLYYYGTTDPELFVEQLKAEFDAGDVPSSPAPATEPDR